MSIVKGLLFCVLGFMSLAVGAACNTYTGQPACDADTSCTWTAGTAACSGTSSCTGISAQGDCGTGSPNTGCNWATSTPATCTGSAISCTSQSNQACSLLTGGCTWTGSSDTCTGTPTACSQFTTAGGFACEFVGCTWTSGCSGGTISSCQLDLKEQAGCEEVGCVWHAGGGDNCEFSMGGAPNGDCTQVTVEDDCTLIGCTWSSGSCGGTEALQPNRPGDALADTATALGPGTGPGFGPDACTALDSQYTFSGGFFWVNAWPGHCQDDYSYFPSGSSIQPCVVSSEDVCLAAQTAGTCTWTSGVVEACGGSATNGICSTFDTDQTTCDLLTGCSFTAGTGSCGGGSTTDVCTDFQSAQPDCDSIAGCSYTPAGGTCSGTNTGTCSGTASGTCTAVNGCQWVTPGTCGDAPGGAPGGTSGASFVFVPALALILLALFL